MKAESGGIVSYDLWCLLSPSQRKKVRHSCVNDLNRPAIDLSLVKREMGFGNDGFLLQFDRAEENSLVSVDCGKNDGAFEC